ncbi:6-phosphofructokinase [Quadrisphaera granulorum]|uniref:ATP-dependent 6-phosphofructokinase n=1 Tax=Quadrisphaera granulorum TaxID=317664 RepID=A0A316A892_9ACTN|nr:6-phosphofructokinase [Quadrisphaera granulorum]SZE96402.1 6-phosphofructokinase [Quadrisphaera granulorum]
MQPGGASQWQIATLGTARLDSPLKPLIEARERSENYVDESDLVLVDDVLSTACERGVPVEQLPGLEPGGPRRKIFFDPSKLRAAIVTCGGLCPGLNNVVRGVVDELWWQYGVRRIHGIRNGYEGFIASYGHEVLDLTPASVRGIDEQGGTVLGTSRGQQDPEEVVDCLERLGIGVLFVVGGDGSMRGALRIASVVAERGLKISVVGIPKTIDNDIPFIDHSFGFQTAFARAAETIRSVVVEARSTPHGVGLVKLMGRHSGFIAAYAALARNDADFVLVPEVPFGLDDDADGRPGLLSLVQQRVAERGNAIVVVAEGAGQDLVPGEGVDASGNAVLGDVGRYLRRRLLDSFAEAGRPVNLRYVDPSYAIRSVPANGYDAVFCLRLAHAAVHAAMAGRTAMVVGRWHGRFVHVPTELAISRRNVVDPHGDLWLSVLEATGQPPRIG